MTTNDETPDQRARRQAAEENARMKAELDRRADLAHAELEAITHTEAQRLAIQQAANKAAIKQAKDFINWLNPKPPSNPNPLN